jgi:hypothetical protein
MGPRVKSPIAFLLLIAITTLTILLGGACRKPRQYNDGETTVEQAGEPEQYSATVIRTIHDGTSGDTTVTHEYRSGEKRREEWTERDQNWALIWRPDLGKSFLLDLDRRVYVELEITARHVGGPDSLAGKTDISSSPNVEGDSTVQAIDHYFDDTQSPVRVETRMLPPLAIDSHPCRVYEQRTIFVDGHTEIIRRFRAEDLAGLPLRIDCESEQGGIRVTTERREVRLEVASDSFVVPADFKRIERLR